MGSGCATRVFLADNLPLVRIGIRTQLAQANLVLEMAGEAGSCAELQTMLAAARPGDVLITDYTLRDGDAPGGGGLRMLTRVRRAHPELRIVVLTEVCNPTVLITLVESGVHALVDKAAPCAEFIDAVRKACVGRMHVCAGMRRRLDQLGSKTTDAGSRISSREAEVVRLFAQGMTVSEIARLLSRSVKTISRQKSDAMRKLGIENHAQLVLHARESGLTPSVRAGAGVAA